MEQVLGQFGNPEDWAAFRIIDTNFHLRLQMAGTGYADIFASGDRWVCARLRDSRTHVSSRIVLLLWLVATWNRDYEHIAPSLKHRVLSPQMATQMHFLEIVLLIISRGFDHHRRAIIGCKLTPTLLTQDLRRVKVRVPPNQITSPI